MDIHGLSWTSMGIHGLPWISMDIHGLPWISMDIHGYPWISMDSHGYLWIAMDIHGLPWTSMDLHGPPSILVQSSFNPSSGPVTCDTFGPDYSSSSFACGCKSCNMCTTILVETPPRRACVGIMCHTFSKKPSSSSEIL